MTARAYPHKPVLLHEAVTALEINAAGTYVDCTFGRGGHSRAILARLNETGHLFAIDRDPMAIEFAKQAFAGEHRVTTVHGPFSELQQIIESRGLAGKVSGVLLDLGVSSPQLEDAARGFSFNRDGPLDMRMDPATGFSAADWLSRADEQEIRRVLQEYGEERKARRIARAIVEQRQHSPITTTRALADIIAGVVKSHEQNIHPATRSFQAIRILVNSEIAELQRLLDSVIELLAVKGRLVVISFHSLEDRIVKRFMRRQAHGDSFPPGMPVSFEMMRPRLRLVGAPVRPSGAEIADNPRARSAIMRVAERIG